MARDPRLRFHLQSQGAVWYHQAASRNHVLIDPQAPARSMAPGFVRPIELWRAQRWQRPPSASIVRYHDADHPVEDVARPEANGAAGFDSDEPPTAGEVISRGSVIDFIGDVTAFRLGALGALIDAVAAALDGGPPVVLATPSADQGAFWIGVVSFFAPPALTLRLSFSTYERFDDVLAQIIREQAQETTDPGPDGPSWRTPVLSVVPETDVDGLSRRDDLPVVVVDPRVEATLVAVDGVAHRRTHLGQSIRVTDWSRLALDACCEDLTALERCLRRLDEVSLATPPSGGLRGEWWPADVDGPMRLATAAGPAWPLAAAVALTAGLPLALPTATRVILRDTPSSMRLSSELASALTSLVVATVDDAEQAWDRLQSALSVQPVRGALVQAAFESYLWLALADDSWLLRQLPPLPPSIPFDPALPGRLRNPLSALFQRLSSVQPADADVRHGVLLLRAIDFAHRVSVLVQGPDLTGLGMARLAARAGAILLDGDTGARAAELAGPLDGAAIARWIIPELVRDPGSWPGSELPIGERLPAAVVALLARAIDPARLGAVTRPEDLTGEPVALEVAVASATGRIAGDQRLRGPAVEYLLYLAVRNYPDADPGAMVAEVFERVQGEPWSATSLLQVVQAAPTPLGSHLVPVALRHLRDWIDDPHSARLAGALLKRIEFLPRRGGDGQPRPRRAGTTDAQAQLLNLLAATGTGWLELDDGLHRRAAEILMWADRAWPGADQQVRRLIAPRITVAAFQVALAAEPAQSATVLSSRLSVVPVGSAWRAAVPLGLETAMPMVASVLRLNRYRMAGELVGASTRAMLDPADQAGDLPRLPMLPIGPVLRWLVGHEPVPELTEHLAALVSQEIRGYEGPLDRPGLRAFWERALPGASLAPTSPSHDRGVLEVALGAGRPVSAGVAALMAPPERAARVLEGGRPDDVPAPREPDGEPPRRPRSRHAVRTKPAPWPTRIRRWIRR